VLDRIDRGGFHAPSASCERSIPRLTAPSPGSVRAWDVKVCLTLVVVLITVMWVGTGEPTPAAMGSAITCVLCAAAGRSVVRYRRVQLA
jgi:hypothetical protein